MGIDIVHDFRGDTSHELAHSEPPRVDGQHSRPNTGRGDLGDVHRQGSLDKTGTPAGDKARNQKKDPVLSGTLENYTLEGLA